MSGRANNIPQSEALTNSVGPESMADVLGKALHSDAAHHFELSRRAMSAWMMSNGDLERQHTVRVWLRNSPGRGVDPIMVVEVDSHSLLSDFNAKRDLYLGRLAYYGQQVSRIEFRFSMRSASVTSGFSVLHERSVRRAQREELQARAEIDQQRVAELTRMVPESLREVVRTAVSASLYREQQEQEHSTKESSS